MEERRIRRERKAREERKRARRNVRFINIMVETVTFVIGIGLMYIAAFTAAAGHDKLALVYLLIDIVLVWFGLSLNAAKLSKAFWAFENFAMMPFRKPARKYNTTYSVKR